MESLPQDFTGVFNFTNWTEEDFKASWNNVEYTFPALKSSPMIIPGEAPEGVQNIRKLFAKKLAEREFYKTDKFKNLNDKRNVLPATYTDTELTPFIQKCLDPLEIAPMTAKVLPKDSEKNYRATKAVKNGSDLNIEFKEE